MISLDSNTITEIKVNAFVVFISVKNLVTYDRIGQTALTIKTMKYLPYLDLARALAVILVFWVHFVSLFMPDMMAGSLYYSVKLGHEGVNIFFVLSGYLLYAAFLRNTTQPVIPYLKKRARRIFPAYWTVLSLYTILIMMGMSDKLLPHSFTETLQILLNNVFLYSPFLSQEPWVSVSWTLTFEWVWYLILPVIFVLNWAKTNRLSRIIALLTIATATGGYWGGHGGPEQFSLFFWGAVLAEVHHSGKLSISYRGAKLAIALLGVVSIAGAVLLQQGMLAVSITLSGAGWALLLYLAINAKSQDLPPWLLPAKMLGVWSYSFYLIHSLVLHAIHRFSPDNTALIWSFFTGFSVSVLASFICYRVIEQRFMHQRAGYEKGKMVMAPEDVTRAACRKETLS